MSTSEPQPRWFYSPGLAVGNVHGTALHSPPRWGSWTRSVKIAQQRLVRMVRSCRAAKVQGVYFYLARHANRDAPSQGAIASALDSQPDLPREWTHGK